MSTCALWRWTTCDGRPAMSRNGYCSVERVIVTSAIRPLWTWTLTHTSPRRLEPWPVKVPSLSEVCDSWGAVSAGGTVGCGAVRCAGRAVGCAADTTGGATGTWRGTIGGICGIAVGVARTGGLVAMAALEVTLGDTAPADAPMLAS